MLQQGSSNDLVNVSSPNVSYNQSRESLRYDLDWRNVFALFDHQDFNPSFSWISLKTGVSVEKVSRIIDGLIVLGFIKRTEFGFQVLKPEYDNSFFGPVNNEDRIEAHVTIAQQIVNLRTNGIYGIDRIAVVASNKKLLLKLHEGMDNLFKDFREKSLIEEKDGVYGVAVMGTDLLPKKGDFI